MSQIGTNFLQLKLYRLLFPGENYLPDDEYFGVGDEWICCGTAHIAYPENIRRLCHTTKASVELTEMPVNYTGHHDLLAVKGCFPTVQEKPGVQLEKISGASLLTLDLTVTQAEQLGALLLKAAQQQRLLYPNHEHL
jgi:hypothetical protein